MKKQLFIYAATIIILFITIWCIITSTYGIEKNDDCIVDKYSALSQYATYKDLGYECELWHAYDMQEDKALKYVTLLRVRRDKSTPWVWVEQPIITLTTTKNQPKDILLRKKIDAYDILLEVDK